MQRSRVVVVLAVLAATLLSSTLSASGEFAPVRGVADVLQLPDGARVDLDSVIVNNAYGPYLFVRDMWDSQSVLPVYANTFVQQWWSLRVLGRTATVWGERILIAERISLYEDSIGQPFIMMPPNMLYADEWPYVMDVPVEIDWSESIPAPPQLVTRPPEPIPVEPGTIASAKAGGAESLVVSSQSSGTMSIMSVPPQSGSEGAGVTVMGKVVTAVFPTAGFFYIQEDDRSRRG